MEPAIKDFESDTILNSIFNDMERECWEAKPGGCGLGGTSSALYSSFKKLD